MKQWRKQRQIRHMHNKTRIHSRLCCRLTVPLTVLMRCWRLCALLAWHDRRRQRRMKMTRRQMTTMRKTETTMGIMIPTLMGLVYLAPLGAAPPPVNSAQLHLPLSFMKRETKQRMKTKTLWFMKKETKQRMKTKTLWFIKKRKQNSTWRWNTMIYEKRKKRLVSAVYHSHFLFHLSCLHSCRCHCT